MDVPPPTRPTLNVVFGFKGTWKSAILSMASQGVNGIGHSKCAVAVSARTLEGDAIAQAADTDVRNAQTRAVDGNELVDLTLLAVIEKTLDAPQIAESFFAEGDGAGRLHLRIVERLNRSQHHRKPAAIVADARPLHVVRMDF